MILSNIGLYDGIVARYVSASDVPMLSVEYRYAPEYPGLTPVEDSYVALRWLSDHAAELGVDPGRIAVMGDSAGGGIAAGLALLARDRGGPSLAQQILIYPMLDDRTAVPDPELVPFAAGRRGQSHRLECTSRSGSGWPRRLPLCCPDPGDRRHRPASRLYRSR